MERHRGSRRGREGARTRAACGSSRSSSNGRVEEIHVLTLASDEAPEPRPESNAGELLDERSEESLSTATRRSGGRPARSRAPNLDAGRTGDAPSARREGAPSPSSRGPWGSGLGSRQAASATERARVNVQRRVKEAIARVMRGRPGPRSIFETHRRYWYFLLFSALT